MGLGAGPQVPPPPPPPVVQQGPLRDPGRRPPPEAKGTGIIRGRVVAADTGTPLRRAMVSLSMLPPTRPPGTAAAPQGTPATTRLTTTVNGTPVSMTAS